VGGVVEMQTRVYFLFSTCLLEPFSLSPEPPDLLELLINKQQTIAQYLRTNKIHYLSSPAGACSGAGGTDQEVRQSKHTAPRPSGTRSNAEAPL